MSKQSKRHMGGSGEALPSGSIGETIEISTSSFQFQNAPVIDQWYSPWSSTLSLTPGTWLINYQCTLAANQNAGLNAGAALARIENITDSTTLMRNSIWPTYDATNNTAQVNGFGGTVSGSRVVTITANKTYQLQIAVSNVWASPSFSTGYVAIRGDWGLAVVSATRLA